MKLLLPLVPQQPLTRRHTSATKTLVTWPSSTQASDDQTATASYTQLHTYRTLGICVTGTLFLELLQVTPVLKSKHLGTVVTVSLQGRCPSCIVREYIFYVCFGNPKNVTLHFFALLHMFSRTMPSNRVSALKDKHKLERSSCAGLEAEVNTARCII